MLTLLCRDEADILESMLRFHLAQGVDRVIATDNGSMDGSLEILQRFQRRGQLTLLQEAEQTHDQAVWVTRMARMAADMGADWVINSDADEFWWPQHGNLNSTLTQLPESVEGLLVERTNFLPPPQDGQDQRPFYQRQTLRERVSRNSLGRPLPPKLIHRAHPGVEITDGNHGAKLNGRSIAGIKNTAIEILHVPIRSYTQLERKIRQGAEALQRNKRVNAGIGDSWRKIYANHLQQGTLPAYYDGLRPNPAAIAAQLVRGELINDRRLQKALGNPLPRVAVITPYYKEPLAQLRQCHDSVLAQSEPCMHVLVADGHPRRRINHWRAEHVRLPSSHGDIGSTPRLVGSYHAIGLGVDAVAFLDADNWYGPDHVSSMLKAMDQHQADFISSSRTLCRLDGTVMGPCPLTNPDRFIDTNAMLFGRGAFPLLHQWVLMPPYGHLIGDRIMLHHLKSAGLKRQHLNQGSVFYRCAKEGLYRQLNESIPEGVQPRPDYETSFRQWQADGQPPL
ncbi:glycosyltransferase family 2 protein [Synechococcus sp. YX-04-1]|uniref:glycosyltransferase family 2 protein n=1 Tax=Synechococcus sp. YX-04-1 TaxID=3062778 RepID=UPI0026E15C6F|nr:glycosyltransferase [Synechococcus sp. YX-04-1]MDO6351161.1 glycosyltransferase family 2 protein [Synechococcus sp. YX-04-1]